MKNLLKKLISLNIVLAFIVSMPLVNSTVGSYSDTEPSETNILSVSTLDFSLRDLNGFSVMSLFSLTNLKPSERKTETLLIHKDGQLDFKYQLSAFKTGGDDTFCSALTIKAQKEGTTLYNGPLLGLVLPTASTFSGTDEHWDFTMNFTDTNTVLEKLSCGFEIKVLGWQIESDGTWGLSDEEIVSNTVSGGDWSAPASSTGVLNTFYTNASISIPYSASDTTSYIALIDLYMSHNNGLYAEITSQTPSPSGKEVSGSFAVNLSFGDGLYKFYTIATDTAGNVETAPIVSDVSTLLDTTKPVSSAGTLPTNVTVKPITIPFTASDSTSGLSSVSLFMKYNSTGSYVSVVTQSVSGASASGNLSYSLNSGDGLYEFYTIATDVVGNVETASTIRDSFTTLSTIQPVNAGDVVINELMWMGSNEDSSDEWIELKNMNNYPINIGGWKLTKKVSGNEQEMLTVPTGETISANGYYLISKYNVSHSSISAVPNLVTTNVVLINSDLQIKLYKGVLNTANLIDTADDGVGTPLAGDNEVKPDKDSQSPQSSWPQGKLYHRSMERQNIPGDGTLASSWHTCMDTSLSERSYWDIGYGYNQGTPGGQNLSENDPTSPDYYPEEATESAASAVAVIPTEVPDQPNPSTQITLKQIPLYKQDNNEIDGLIIVREGKSNG